MRFLATFVGVGTYADPLIRELVGATRDAKALHALFADSAPSSAQHRPNFNEKIGIIGQVIQTIPNDSGGVRFIISKGTKPTRFSFLSKDCEGGQLPPVGALVSFSWDGTTKKGRGRAHEVEVIASPDPNPGDR